MNGKIVAVVVAWNRAALLAEVLEKLAQQTRPLEEIIVVDNASTDATPQVIAKARAVTDVITMPENLGGAGGFAAGIARALQKGADYIWIMDDDTLPYSNTLEILCQQWQRLDKFTKYATPNREIGLLVCRADWIDGREHPMNKPRVRPFTAKKFLSECKKLAVDPIRTCSFVAPLISAHAIKAVGLPIADYFLWNDDFEYTARILQNRHGFYSQLAKVEHRTKTFGNSATSPGKRFFNEVRNKIWMYRFSHALTLAEKILYGGKTLLRWAKLLLCAADRRDLWKYLWQGVKAGMHRPRTNLKVFANTPAFSDVLSIERKTWEHNH